MDRNSKILIISMIIILLVGGIILYNAFFNHNIINVGNTDFVLPSGYEKTGVNEYGAVILSDGKNKIYVLEYNDTNPQKYVEKYKNQKESENISVYFSEFDVGDKKIYKTTNVNETDNVHFWFEKNNKTYEIYSWDGNPDIDNIVMNIFNS